MQDPKDYILVHGNFWMDSTQSHKEKLTDGVFELKGDFKETGSESENFYASGNHKMLLTGLYTQVIDIKNHNGCRFNILDYSKSKGALIKTPVYVVNKIGKKVNVNVTELVNGLPENMRVDYFISALKELGIKIEAKLYELVNNLIMQFGIEYIVESRENLQNFICGVIIGIDDNLFLGAVTATAKLVGTVKGELPEDNYSFMLGKVITDVMFIAFFNASSIQAFYSGMMFTSVALSSAGAGAVLFIPTAGGSALVAVPVSVASINVAAASFTVAIVAEAGAMHSKSLLNDDQSKLKEAKRDKGAAEAIEDILSSAKETTNGKGVARNFEKSGGYEKTLKDFESLNPTNIKDIQTQYGSGKVGTLSDGTKVVARQGSKTGGPTLEITVSKKKIFKVRY